MTRLCPRAAKPTINPSPPIMQSITKPRKASSEPRRSGAAGTAIRLLSGSAARELVAFTTGGETRFAISVSSQGRNCWRRSDFPIARELIPTSYRLWSSGSSIAGSMNGTRGSGKVFWLVIGRLGGPPPELVGLCCWTVMYCSRYLIKSVLGIDAPPGPVKLEAPKLMLVSPPAGACVAT